MAIGEEVKRKRPERPKCSPYHLIVLKSKYA